MPTYQGSGDDTDDSTQQGQDADDGNVGDNSGPLLGISWDSIVGVPIALRKFGQAPIAFIFGAFLSVFIGGLETIIEAFIDAFLAVFDAVALIPTTGGQVISDAAGGLGSAVLDAFNGLFETLAMAAAMAGPGAPILLGAVVAVTIIATAYAMSFAYDLVKDSINPL